jgi:hypothetical protein
MKILPGRQPGKQIAQGLVLAPGLGIGLCFDLRHQVHPAAVAADDIGQRRHPGADGGQLLQGALGNHPGQAKDPLQAGIVDHNRPEIPGPADVELDAPHTLRQRGIEGRQGVLQNRGGLVRAAVGDDSAVFQLLRARIHLGQPGIDPVDGRQQQAFKSVKKAHGSRFPGPFQKWVETTCSAIRVGLSFTIWPQGRCG